MHWQLGVRSPSLRRCFATGPRIIRRKSGTYQAKAEVNTIGAASLNQRPYYTRGRQHSHFKRKTNPSFIKKDSGSSGSPTFRQTPQAQAQYPQAQQQQQGKVSYQQGQQGTGSETSQKTGPTTQRVHSVTASDEQVDGRSGTGTEGGLAPLRAETDAKYIANRV